ncbi:MAG TPA: hypothetical protein VLL28_16550, partial [Hyphomicrobiaceae bacterium]|nr:hypothetical protein [Hyphomicrobiaceae bacterium]
PGGGRELIGARGARRRQSLARPAATMRAEREAGTFARSPHIALSRGGVAIPSINVKRISARFAIPDVPGLRARTFR